MFIRRKQHDREVARLRMEASLQSELASAAMAHAAEMRRQTERRVEEAKEAGELARTELLRTVKALAEEVEFLRAQHFGTRTAMPLNGPPAMPQVPVLPEEFNFMPHPYDNPHYLTEEEEEVHALRAAGHLDKSEYDAALAQLRAVVGGPIQIES